MIKYLNVYVARAAAITRRDGLSVIERFARTLAERNGVTKDLTIVRKPGGKPAFVQGPPFNGSHSGDYAVCVFDDGPVGIDLQQIDTTRDMAHYMKIARRFFHPAETRRLEALPEPERRRAFFDLWSEKEAVMKFTGEGFALPMADFMIDDVQRVTRGGQALPVTLVSCDVAPGYVCWLAVGQKKNTLAPRDIVVRVKKVSF